MSYRPTFQGRPDLRNPHRPPLRKPFLPHHMQHHNHHHNQHHNQQKGGPQQFFSKSLVVKGKQFIKLFCPHCHTRCLTFGDYKNHLHADKHLRAISRRIQIVEREVETKRKEQQQAQVIADKEAQAHGTSSSVLKYCAVCDLHFNQDENKHVATRLHVFLQKLLEPVCKICVYVAKDAVDYENHLCSLEHLKKEEGWTGEQEGVDEGSTASGPGSGSSAMALPKQEYMRPSTSAQRPRTPIDTNRTGAGASLGAEVILKVEVLYCSVCKLYISCEVGQDAALHKHCATNDHLRNWALYVEERHKKDQASF